MSRLTPIKIKNQDDLKNVPRETHKSDGFYDFRKFPEDPQTIEIFLCF
jgi:hypothetical protein